ncbi:MAG: hypothetical protein OEY94_04100 [Alphaproteobacteria bacterium]|nr:hypothetical protein [Alphaproteobacteria bacterium]
MKKSRRIFIFIIIFILICGFGGFILYQKHAQKQQLTAQHIAEEKVQSSAVNQASLEERKERYKKFEIILNGLLRDVGTQAKLYKKQRNVLKEILDPYNFKTPNDAAQSYKAFVEIIMPGLRNQADNVMGVFDTYQTHVEETLKDIPDEKKEVFLRKWNTMIKDKIEEFILFFQKEEKILEAYKNLLEFYYKNSNTYVFKEENEKIIFLDEHAKTKETALTLEIQTLLSQKQ